MTEAEELDTSSNLSGTDLLWRSVKMDLALNRANQAEQLQLLKGAILRQPAKKKAKRAIKIQHMLKKKYLKRKVFQKALKMFRTFKSRLQKKRKDSAVKDDCISTMTFKVIQNVSEKNISNEAAMGPKVNSQPVCEPRVRHQSVQTGTEILQESSNKSSTMGPPKIPPSTSTSHPLASATSAVPPVLVLPPIWGPWIQPVHAVGTFCSNSSSSASLGIQQPLGSESLSTKESLPQAHFVNQPHTSLGYSLKDLCEQLLLQLSSREMCKETVAASRKNVDNMGDPPISHTAEVSSNKIASTNEAKSTIKSQKNGFSTCHKRAEMKSQTISPIVTVPSSKSLTPDLLRVSQFHCVLDHDPKDIGGHCPSDMLMKDATTQQCNDPPVNAKPVQEDLSNQEDAERGQFRPILDMPCTSSSIIHGVRNSPQVQEMNDLTYTAKPPGTSIQAKLSSQTDGKKINPSISANVCKAPANEDINSEIAPANAMKNVARVLFENGTNGHKTCESSTNGGNSSSNEMNASPKMVEDCSPESETKVDCTADDFNSSELNHSSEFDLIHATGMNIPELTTEELRSQVEKRAGAHLSNSTQDQSRVPHVSKCQNLLVNTTIKGSESRRAQEFKVLSLVQKADLSRKSPAFEDMDPAEMENVLLVLRQQELLHQNPQEPAISVSSNFIFKKMKKSPELPPELRHARLFPSPPLKRQSPDNSSALEILEEEAKKPPLEDDDDVPENSPQPVIAPPKRRRLRLNPSPLPVKISRNKAMNKLSEAPATDTPESAESIGNDVHLEPDGVQLAPIDNESVNADTLDQDSVPQKSSRAVRSSKRLKVKESNNPEKQDTKKVTRNSAGKVLDGARSTKKTVYELVDELSGKSKQSITCNPEPNDIGSKVDKSITSTDASNPNVNDSTSNNGSEPEITKSGTCDSPDFTDQMKERANKLKRQWLLKKTSDEKPDSSNPEFKAPFPVRALSPIPSLGTDTGSILLTEKKINELREVPIVEIGRAHDIITQALLNPWRGLVARNVTRGFICPTVEAKKISRCLWDLRSNAGPKEVSEQIIALNWKDTHPHAIKSLVSMFVLALSRQVPFVFEADIAEDDDTCSISSDAEHTGKKRTPIRLIASKQIFKGECIEGLNGLLMKTSMSDKEKLRTWSFPKFKQSRDWVLFGPLAYLKRKESSFNTKAIILQGELIAVKATRHILRGEKLTVSFAALEKQLTK